MKNYKTLFIISVLINLLVVWYYFIPKYSLIGVNSSPVQDSYFELWWYVKWLNFEDPWVEFYLIFGIPNYDTASGIWQYFYLNWMLVDKDDPWSRVYTDLAELKVKNINSEKIELYDNVYQFEIYKSSGKVFWTDKKGNKFELVTKKQYNWF